MTEINIKEIAELSQCTPYQAEMVIENIIKKAKSEGYVHITNWLICKRRKRLVPVDVGSSERKEQITIHFTLGKKAREIVEAE